MEKKAKILVVEDDRIIALEIKERLIEFNYEVVATAKSGEQAIEFVSALYPDLILMDIHIEGDMDGIETAKKIKQTNNIPLIYLTAYADDKTIERAKITEPYGYIVKPLDERELKSAVEIALYKHSTEKLIKDSETKYRAIVDTIEGSLFLVNIKREIVFVNKFFNEKVCKDYLKTEPCYKILFSKDYPCDNCKMNEVLEGKTVRSEVYNKNTDKWYYLLNSPVQLSNGEIYNQHLLMDITNQKKTEETLITLLKDKELLLREVHHRVKNNLQMMLSLLRLQGAETTDITTKENLKSFENRLFSLSLLHEDLYSPNKMGKILFQNYLKKLSAHLTHAFMINTNNITINIDANNFYLEPEIAIPCGVIINELLTNSFKYAFPDDREGVININMTLNNDNYELIYNDNGIGISNDTILNKKNTLGMQLVKSLSSQLGNYPVINNGNGLGYKFIIKPVKQKERMECILN